MYSDDEFDETLSEIDGDNFNDGYNKLGYSYDTGVGLALAAVARS
jgi:hypothetical protein